MRFLVLLFTLCTLPFSIRGQRLVTTGQILGTAKEQAQFQLQERKLDFLKNTSHQLPFIDRWELRTQTNDLDPTEQRITFRVRPNSHKERHAQQQLHFSTIQFHQEATRKVLLKGVQQRYNTCLTLLFAPQRKQLLIDLESVYLELAKIYEQLGDFDNMMESEEAGEAISLDLFDYEQEIGRAIRKINYYLGDKANFEIRTTDFLTIWDLKQRIKNINPTRQITNPTLALLENEINLVEKELNVAIAEQKKWFNFAQIRYGGKDSFIPFREVFSVAFAFNIPTKNSNLLKKNKLELDRIAAENDWGEANYHLEKERKNLLRDLSNWLEKYEQLSKNLIAAQESIPQSSAASNSTPYELLSLKRRAYLLRKDLRLHQIEEKIYQAYLDWLGVTGKMIELPLVNYLPLIFHGF